MFAASAPRPPGTPPAAGSGFAGSAAFAGGVASVATRCGGRGFDFGAGTFFFGGAAFVRGAASTGVGFGAVCTTPAALGPSGAAIKRTRYTGGLGGGDPALRNRNAATSAPWSAIDAIAPPVSRGAAVALTVSESPPAA